MKKEVRTRDLYVTEAPGYSDTSDRADRMCQALATRSYELAGAGAYASAAECLIMADWVMRYGTGLVENDQQRHWEANAWICGHYGISLDRGWNYIEACILDEFSGDKPLV